MTRSRFHRRSDWFDVLPDEPVLVEPAAARRRRLTLASKDGKKVQEVDRSGSLAHLERAAKRLKHVKAEDRVLRVPQWDMEKAASAMRKAGVSGAVSNLCGTRSKRIKRGR